nr:RsmB/NOP family class I SAM-dependent RNA methyltransferase [Ameyamaea chiangmaiensis]
MLAQMQAEPRRPADALANSFFRERRYIGGGDRRFISAIVWDVLRRWRRLEWHLQRAGSPEATPRLLAGALLLYAGDGDVLRDVEGLFTGEHYAPERLTRAEHAILATLAGTTLDDPSMPDPVRLEVPDWLMPSLVATFGDRLSDELAAMGEPAPLDLRVNLLMGTREQAAASLARAGIETTPCHLSPWGLRAAARQSVTTTQAFQSGLVEIQDEGSQLVVAAVGARPEMRVLDYCAGAGGKTLGMAMTMHNRGHIVACDVSEPRLEGAVRRLRRAGVHNVERHLIVAGDKWAKRRAASFDRVLVDAPCTGTGTWRRNPDARLRLRASDLSELQAKQAEILDRAASLVRPGGRLIYATCSILDDENISQIHAFIGRHSEFRLVPSDSADMPAAFAACATLSLSPALNGTDGFFAAILERSPGS